VIDFKKLKEDPLMLKSQKIAEILYQVYKKEEKRECGELFLDWVKENFWGKIIKTHISTFNKTWKILHKRNYTKIIKLTMEG